MMLNEYEAWMEIATHMERGRVVPSGRGLCACIAALESWYVVASRTADAMQNRLMRKHYRIPPGVSRGYFWHPGELAPRIRACKDMAEECLKEAKILEGK
jgi:hypothetical protein